MTRMFETGEITKLLDVLIGKTEAVGETNEDERRLDNLKTLIDVTNWCLDGLQFAMASGYGRPEYSMAEISYTAQCALDNYRGWIADVLDEQIADRKTEPNCSEIPNNSKGSEIPTGSEIPNNCEDEPQQITSKFTDVGNSMVSAVASTMEQLKSKLKDEPQTEEEYINNLPWTEVGNGEQTDDAYFLELMGAVERGEISDAGANQAWYEYINHKDEPQTERYCTNCKHNGVIEDYECRECCGMDKHEFIEPQTDCPWK